MLKLLITASIIVFVATLIDIALLHHQATVGKLLWKIKLFPDLGGQL